MRPTVPAVGIARHKKGNLQIHNHLGEAENAETEVTRAEAFHSGTWTEMKWRKGHEQLAQFGSALMGRHAENANSAPASGSTK